MALHYYRISDIPEKSYYKALAVVSIMNYKKTAYAILEDKVNKNNITENLKRPLTPTAQEKRIIGDREAPLSWAPKLVCYVVSGFVKARSVWLITL